MTPIEPHCPSLPVKCWNSRTLKRIAIFLSLTLAVALTWGIIHDRWRPADWGTPVDYSGDSLLTMSIMKHAANGDLHLIGYINSEKVGAPYLGNLNDFPLTERPLFYLGGQLSRFVELGAVMNLLVVSAHILAAFSFYMAARLWRIAKPFAWCLALPYAFIPYALGASDAQLPLLFYGLLPLQLHCCWYLSSSPSLSWKDKRFRLLLIVAALSGVVHIYLILPFIFLCVLALLRRALNRQQYLWLAGIPLVVTCLLASLTLSSHFFYWASNGSPSAFVRHYNDLERGSLKPIDLFLPGYGQAFGLFDNVYQRYTSGGAYITYGSFRLYIGILGIAGLLILVLRSFQNSLTRRSIPTPALILLFFLAYSCFGGANTIFGLLTKVYLIRGTNRYSYIIATISFLYLAFSLSRSTRNWRMSLRISLGVLTSWLGLADQALPKFKRHLKSADRIVKKIESDRSLADKLRAELPSQGMLFMLPVMSFPESGRLHNLADYELTRPFLYSDHLRFSYGSHKGRPEFEWQREIALSSGKTIIADLESYGFSGILLNRLAYPDQGESLLKEFKSANRSPRFEHDKNWVFIPLEPEIKLPAISHPTLFSMEWMSPEGEKDDWRRWTGNLEQNQIHIITNRDGLYQFTIPIGALGKREITILLDGEILNTLAFTKGGVEIFKSVIELKKGKNTLSFSTDQPAIKPSKAEKRYLSFYVKRPKLEWIR